LKKLSPEAVFGESTRGRPRHMSNLYEDPLKSIIPIAEKYDLNPMTLVEAFITSWRREKTSRCGSLTIYCRQVDPDAAVFLVTNEGKVVSQLSIKLRALRDPVSFKTCLQSIPAQDYSRKELEHGPRSIDELKCGMKNVTVKAEIIEIPPMRAVITRFGDQSYVSNVVIADGTGSIKLSLWNEQIDAVHVGDHVEIENGYIASFAGEPQLRLGRKGSVSVSKQLRP